MIPSVVLLIVIKYVIILLKSPNKYKFKKRIEYILIYNSLHYWECMSV